MLTALYTMLYALLRSEDCPATILNLCDGCADGPTGVQVDAAVSVERP